MDLAAVVVTRNQHDVLRPCLRSVLDELSGIHGEVVVVDNASSDDTQRMLATEFPQVRVIRNDTNLHYTRAVNQGMRATGSRYVFLLNDDTELKTGCLRSLAAFMNEHPRCGAVGPALLSPSGDVQVSAQKFPTPVREMMAVSGIAWRLRNHHWADAIQARYPLPMHMQAVDWVCGGALFLRRSAMEGLGYHDEEYLFYRDDPDIGMRMRATGWEVWYCPQARVVHHHGVSTVKTDGRVRFELISVRSRRHYHRKFHGLPALLLVESCYGLCLVLRLLKAALLLRREALTEQWRGLTLLFEALAVPREEAEAIVGYRRSAYNGMDPVTCEGGRGMAGAASSCRQTEQGDRL